MKRLLLAIFALATLLALVFAFSPAAAKDEPRSISYIQSLNYHGKGLIFKFELNGKFKDYEFKDAVVWWNKHPYSLSCNKDGKSLVCVAEAGLRKQIGKLVVIEMAGFRFFTTIPEITEMTILYCYSVWDYWPFTNNDWADMTPYLSEPACSRQPAQLGDVFHYEFYLPGVTDPYVSDTIFSNDGGEACAPNYGPAYYYSDC